MSCFGKCLGRKPAETPDTALTAQPQPPPTNITKENPVFDDAAAGGDANGRSSSAAAPPSLQASTEATAAVAAAAKEERAKKFKEERAKKKAEKAAAAAKQTKKETDTADDAKQKRDAADTETTAAIAALLVAATAAPSEAESNLWYANATVEREKKAPGSWKGDVLPASVEDLPAFGGGAEVDVALALAEKFGLKDSIMASRRGVARELYRLVLTGCLAAGDSRKDSRGPLGNDCWLSWDCARERSDKGYELNKMVIDAIVILQTSPSIEALGELVNQLSALVFGTIPEGDDAGGEGGGDGTLQDKTTHPVQALAFLKDIKDKYGGFSFGVFPMANYTPAMLVEIKAAVATIKAGVVGDLAEFRAAKLKAGLFGDPEDFCENYRADLMYIVDHTLDGCKEISAVQYLQVLGINRFETFHAKGLGVALAAGGDKSSYSAGPLKHEKRVNAKCAPGGDYTIDYEAGYELPGQGDKKPPCKYVMDVVRGTVKCKTRSMMVRATAAAVKTFGEPAVVKDRRNKPQHDVLMVFDHEELYVELQFHYEDTLAVKVLAHTVFEIKRLKAEDKGSVTSSGLNTVMKLPQDMQYDSAAKTKMLLHI